MGVRAGRQGIRTEGDEDCFLTMGNHCSKGQASIQAAYHPDRIKYPMKRKSWQPGGGENAHGELRGKDEWERISWDEAIDAICTKIKEYQAEFGSGSVCSFTYALLTSQHVQSQPFGERGPVLAPEPNHRLRAHAGYHGTAAGGFY